jgi:SAM-dependent methyltransferase
VTAVTPDLIFQVANGFMAAKHLFVANEVGLFEALGAAPATLDDLAQRIGVPRRTLRILADAMVALGLLERHGARYRNTPVASAFLSGRTPTDLRPALRYWNRLNYPRWAELEAVVRTGQAVFGEFAFTAEEQQLYTEGVEAITAGTALALAATYDFGRHRRVLDLGGGTGSFLLAVLRQHPHVEATLFDVPAVAALARQRLAGSPVAARLRVVEGDFFTDPLPEDHDAVLLANVLHNFLPERNRALLGRVAACAPAGARLVLVDFWTDPTHTQPLTAALMAGAFLLVMGEGDVYSAEDVRDWLQASGWLVPPAWLWPRKQHDARLLGPKACSRLPTGATPASLPLSAAAHAWRWTRKTPTNTSHPRAHAGDRERRRSSSRVSLVGS